MEDERIVALYWERDEQAITETEKNMKKSPRTFALNGEETGRLTNYRIAVPVEKGAVSDTGQITVHLS